MSSIEVAYQWRPGNGGFSTGLLVAIPNAGPPLDWSRVFARLRTGAGEGKVDPKALDPEAFGRLIVEEGGAGRRAEAEREPQRAPRLAFEAVACLDLERAGAVKSALDALAVALGSQDSKRRCRTCAAPAPLASR
jgi:clostripain